MKPDRGTSAAAQTISVDILVGLQCHGMFRSLTKLHQNINGNNDMWSYRCYVGSGPSHNIWRSCNHRALNDKNPNFSPSVSYLHDRLPPTINSLTNSEVANLTKDNALLLFKGSPADFKLDATSSSSEDFPTNTTAPAHLSHTHPNEPIKFGNVLDDEGPVAESFNTTITRVNRRSPRKNVKVVKVSRRVDTPLGAEASL